MTLPTKTNIFNHLFDHSKLIEAHWSTIIENICNTAKEHPHLDIAHFNQLNDKFRFAIERLHKDLQSPTLILATTGTTSSGKSTIVNLLCGADLMPRMTQEMSAGVVYIHNSPDNKRILNIHKTDGALWECDEWHDLSDSEIRNKLTTVMDSFNTNKHIGQLASPHIELTYPLACFNNPELLALSNLPKSTQFKLMDLPGLRNHQDNTNAQVIKSCRDALCLVAYNMEETDENRRIELVQQVLQQIKHMGGSPARMMFILNRIDAFLSDHEADRRRDEHIDKVKTEITDILYKELPEHRDTLENLTFSPLSSLPALHAQLIKSVNDRIHSADELDKHFNSLIPEELLDDLPRRISSWKDHDFQRINEVVWNNSYGAEFFKQLDNHIQIHFPTLVIPTIVQNFEKEVGYAIGELSRTCYSELNSSEETYAKARELLIRQNSELREFIAQANSSLIEPIEYLKEELKKNPGSISNALEIFSEALFETKIYQGTLTEEKLTPLFSWNANIKTQALGVLTAVKQSLIAGHRDFKNTTVENLPNHLQLELANECHEYLHFYTKIKLKEEQQLLNGNSDLNVTQTLNHFLESINKVVHNVITIYSSLENKRIHDTIDLLMKHYLDYLRNNIKTIAPEWNLSINNSILNNLHTPEIYFFDLKTHAQNSTREVHYGFLWLFTKIISYKKFPSHQTLHNDIAFELIGQLDSLLMPFQEMLYQYFVDLNANVVKEQESVLEDFNNKLNQAYQQNIDDYEKVKILWEPLLERTQQLDKLTNKLIYNWDSL
ncbi:MAG: dynamin family protein [Methylococcales bacterium]|nr:dynamin family protein [Methylococcales bacterium]